MIQDNHPAIALLVQDETCVPVELHNPVICHRRVDKLVGGPGRVAIHLDVGVRSVHAPASDRRSLGLIGLGILFLAGGWALEKTRRGLVAGMGKADVSAEEAQ